MGVCTLSFAYGQGLAKEKRFDKRCGDTLNLQISLEQFEDIGYGGFCNIDLRF
jgi:hypothetical protein